MAWHRAAPLGMASRCWATPGLARLGKHWSVKHHRLARQSLAWHGTATPGRAWVSQMNGLTAYIKVQVLENLRGAWPGYAGPGKATPGMARLDKVRLGEARQGLGSTKHIGRGDG